jgi:triosephosphate isomerase (TIM)
MQKTILLNWKANKNIIEAEYWINNFPKDLLLKQQNIKLLLAPPYPFLSQMKRLIDHQQLPISLAVQDVSAYGSGAYTGEVSAENLEFLGVEAAIIGHSERRRLFCESSQLIVGKVQQAIQAGLEVVLCLDETDFPEQAKLLTKTERAKISVAYEPVAAIGTGQAVKAISVKNFFKKLRQYFPHNSLIYGGSVNANNINDFLAVSDGVLVSSAALELSDLSVLIQAIAD